MRLFRPSSVRRLALLGALAVTAAACDEDEPSTPAQIAGVPGQSVAGRAGEVVPVTVRVAASNGRALANQTVTFSPTTGTVNPATATTDAAGQAQTVWTLGSAVGQQTLTATVGTVAPITITATVTAGRPARVEIQAGNNQTAAVGQTVTTRPAVIVRDAGNNPVAGANVVFSVQSGGGTVTGGVTTTDQNGVATVGTFQLGNQAGPNVLTAQVLDTPTGGQPLVVTFTAVGTAGAPARITASRGASVSGVAGTALGAGDLPAVLVTDVNGNPAAGVAVTFTATTGGGTVTGATATTNALGVASLGGFTLGRTVGPNIITASAQGVGSTSFTVTGAAGPAARVEVSSGNNQEVRANANLTAPPTVRVVDQFGNPVQGATVTFEATAGGGSVTGGTQQTNAQGFAAPTSVRLGATPGTNTFVARVGNLTVATFTAIGLAGTPAQLTGSPVTADTVRVIAFGQTNPLTVTVRDADGFPVRGVTVNFAVDSAKAGTLSASSAVTDAQGQASVSLTAGAVVDTAVVTASVTGVATPVTFTVVVARNTPATVTLLQGAGQSATAGTIVAVNPAVEVRDAAGRPVAGVTVQFAIVSQNLGGGLIVPPGGALVEGGNGVIDTTDATGRAEVGGWQLGGTPGENILTIVVQAASVAGNPVRITAQGVAGPGAGTTVAVVAGSGQTVPVGTVVPVPPAVIVRNAAGQPLAGVTVEFRGSAGSLVNGSANAVNVQTGPDGVARLTSWRLSTTPGLNTLSVAVVGAGAATQITATGQ